MPGKKTLTITSDDFAVMRLFYIRAVGRGMPIEYCEPMFKLICRLSDMEKANEGVIKDDP